MDSGKTEDVEYDWSQLEQPAADTLQLYVFLIHVLIGIIISVAMAVVLSLFFDSIVDMWYYIGTIGISAMIVPILIGFFYPGKKYGISAVISMLAGFFTALIWVIHGYLNAQFGWPVYLWGSEPLYPGLLISLAAFIVVNIIKSIMED